MAEKNLVAAEPVIADLNSFPLQEE